MKLVFETLPYLLVVGLVMGGFVIVSLAYLRALFFALFLSRALWAFFILFFPISGLIWLFENEEEKWGIIWIVGVLMVGLGLYLGTEVFDLEPPRQFAE